MKPTIYLLAAASMLFPGVGNAGDAKRLFMDVHELDAVTAEAVAEAHGLISDEIAEVTQGQ